MGARIRRGLLGLAVAGGAFVSASPVDAYSTFTSSGWNCSTTVGYGYNYAGQGQMAISSGDTDCATVHVAIRYSSGGLISQKYDSSNYFSAVRASYSATNGDYNYQATNGLWKGGRKFW